MPAVGRPGPRPTVVALTMPLPVAPDVALVIDRPVHLLVAPGVPETVAPPPVVPPPLFRAPPGVVPPPAVVPGMPVLPPPRVPVVVLPVTRVPPMALVAAERSVAAGSGVPSRMTGTCPKL